MTEQENFSDTLFDFFLQAEVLDEENAESLVILRDGEQIEVGFSIPVSLTDIKLIVCPRVEVNDIFLALTDGPENDIVLLLERLSEEALNSSIEWASVTEISIDYFNAFGIHGLYFSKLKFVDLFEDFDDFFDYREDKYKIKTVLFLSEKETKCFFESEDKFYDLVGNKDPVQFSQLSIEK